MKVIISAKIEMEVVKEEMEAADIFDMEMFKDGTIEILKVDMSIDDENGNPIVPPEELTCAELNIIDYLRGR